MDAMRDDHTLFTTAEGIEPVGALRAAAGTRRRSSRTRRAPGGPTPSISWSLRTPGGLPFESGPGRSKRPRQQIVVIPPPMSVED